MCHSSSVGQLELFQNITIFKTLCDYLFETFSLSLTKINSLQSLTIFKTVF